MAIRFARPPELYRDAPYAYTATIAPGSLVFTAGACPIDASGTTVGVGDVRAQARQAGGNLIAALAHAGAQLGDVVKTTVYVASTNPDDLRAAWDEFTTLFGEHEPPSTLLGVTVLGYRGQLVEIEAIALAGDAR